MEKKKVISPENSPTKSPIMAALIFYLCFDKWNAPMWLYGAMGLLFLLWFIAWIISFIKEEYTDIFKK